MSKIVDERVVEMRFDNAQFESNVKTTMSTLDRLKAALKFPSKTDALNSISSNARNATNSIRGVNDSVGTLRASFSALQVMGVTALANITNSAVNAGRRIASALTVQPIMSGFQEYETQMNAVQTILSNTQSKGTTLDDVTAALDELNTYADKTIYNFTEMTRNIGTFTAAGVDLDTSVSAIQGIANLAAVSGSTSQQASVAMYQLSQALATGRVALQDWNSVVNAGMGGELFQEALKRTARNNGIAVDQMIEQYGSFRESLTRGQWLTADILNETLAQIAGAYSREELLAKGYTQSQADEILQLAQNATAAATEVRTFTQLMGTAAEALGSGWTNTWEIIVGDFEQAKELFTGASNIINDYITRSATARNEMLQGWADLGGREDVIEGITNIFSTLLNILTPIKVAFEDIFPPMTSERLKELTNGFKEFTDNLNRLTMRSIPQLTSIFRGLFSVIDLVLDVIGSVVGGIFNFSGNFSDLATAVLNGAASFGDFITSVRNTVSESEILDNVIQGITNAVSQLLSFLSGSASEGVSAFGDVFNGLLDILSRVGGVISDTIRTVGSGLGDLFSTADFGSIIDVFNSGVFATLAVSIRDLFNNISGSVEDSTGGLLDTLKQTADSITENVTKILDSVRGSLQAWQTNIKANTLLTIAAAIAILAVSLTVLSTIDRTALTNALGAITTLFIELVVAMTAFSKVSTTWEQAAGLVALVGMARAVSILATAMKKIAGLEPDQIATAVAGITGLAAALFGLSKGLSYGPGIAQGAIQLVAMSTAIVILSTVVDKLGGLDFNTLVKGLGGIGALMAEMAIFSRLVKTEGMLSAAVSLVVIAGAIEILYDATVKFGGMNIETLIQGVVGVAAILGMFAGITRIMPRGGELVKAAVSIGILSAALISVVPSIERISAVGIEGALTAIIAIGGVFRALTDFIQPLTKMDLGEIGALGWAMDGLVNPLRTAAEAIEKLSAVPIPSIGVSIVAFNLIFDQLMKMMDKLSAFAGKGMGDLAATTVALPIITSSLSSVADAMVKVGGLGVQGSVGAVIAVVGAMKALSIGLDALEGREKDAIALTVVSVALVALGAAINLISAGGIVGVVTSLVGLAATLTIVGLAAKILKPVIPTIYKLSGSLITLGVSLAALGAGSMAFGFGLITMVTGLAGAILTLSSMDPAKAATGLAVLGGAFMTIYVAAKLLRPMLPSILSLSASIISLGLACAAVSVGITVLIAGLTALGSIGKENAEMLVETLKQLVISIAEAIPEVLTSLMESFKTILLGLIDVFVEVAPEMADGILKVITETLQSMTEYGPQIAGFVMDFLIAVINQVGSRIGELVDAVADLLDKLFTAIGQKVSGMDSSGLTTSFQVMGLLSGLAIAFNAIKSLIPGAMQGALGLGILAAEMVAIVAALGGIAQIPGLQWLVSEGGNLLQELGKAIGKFVGGLVGGAVEGFTSGLPEAGSNLSQFMTNLMPFIQGASLITPELGTSIQNLATAILTLTAANVVDSIASFITGGTNWGEFANQLVPFGEAMVEFSTIMKDADLTALSMGAQAGLMLAQMADSMPKEGGLAQAIFGENPDMASFGEELVSFGEAIMKYGKAVKGISEYIPDITQSAQAGKALSDLANSLPKEGGLQAAIFGDTTSMTDFGDDLSNFGNAIITYGQTVAGIADYIEPINQSVQAGQALKDLASALPKEGGLAAAVFGDNPGLDTFGQQLTSFGQAILDYGTKVSGVNFDKITEATSQMSRLLALIKANADDSEGITNGLTNVEKLTGFGDTLSTLWTKISDIDMGKMSSTITNIRNLMTLITDMVGLDTSGVSLFQSAITELANIDASLISDAFASIDTSSIGFSISQSIANGLGQGSDQIRAAAAKIIAALRVLMSVEVRRFNEIGEALVTSFAKGITAKMSLAADEAKNLVQNALNAVTVGQNRAYDAGYNLAIGFANGISRGSFAARTAAKIMADAAANAARKALDEHSPSRVFYSIGAYAGEGMVNALNDYARACSIAGKNVGNEAADGASVGMRLLTNQFDSINLDPTIRPVMDLSDIKNGVSYINSAFSGSSNLDILGQARRINRAVSSNRQNGTTDDVIRELSKLRGDIQTMPVNQYTVNGITYDDGTAIAGSVQELIRATRIERRR